MYMRSHNIGDLKVDSDTRSKCIRFIYFLWFFVSSTALSIGGCSETKIGEKQNTIPKRTFSLNDIILESHSQNKVEWEGKGSMAEGDLEFAEIRELVMHKRDPKTNEIVFTLISPLASLDFAKGTMVLSKTKVEEKNGAIITGGQSVYQTDANHINITGPIYFDAKNLGMIAQSATINLELGEIQAQGPIVGKVQIDDQKQ